MGRFDFFLTTTTKDFLLQGCDVTTVKGHSSGQSWGWKLAKIERERGSERGGERKKESQMKKGVLVRRSWVYSPSPPQLSFKVFPLLASL